MKTFPKLAVVALLCLWGRQSGAVEAILTDDVSISTKAGAKKPRGNAPTLAISETDTIYLNFDIESVLPAGTNANQIGKATLRVWLQKMDTSQIYDQRAGVVGRVLTQWSENTPLNTVTGQPPAIAGDGKVFAFPYRSMSYVVFDVTSFVKAWLSGTQNYGLAVQGVRLFGVDGGVTNPLRGKIDSKENTATGHLPSLQIVLTP